MSDAELSQNLLAFIAAHVHSVVTLESLLLLQSQTHRAWGPGELGSELRIDPQFAQLELDKLMAGGIAVAVEGTDGCMYKPATPELDESVRELVRMYSERRVSVIQAIYAKPVDPVQSFADAFRLRRRNDH